MPRPRYFLMPLAFGALLGGLMTQIGTSPNIIVSRVRGEIVGTPFSMFDFTPVGAVLAVVGLLFLMVAYRMLPVRTRSTASMDEALAAKKYVTEAEVTETSPWWARRSRTCRRWRMAKPRSSPCWGRMTAGRCRCPTPFWSLAIR